MFKRGGNKGPTRSVLGKRVHETGQFEESAAESEESQASSGYTHRLSGPSLLEESQASSGYTHRFSGPSLLEESQASRISSDDYSDLKSEEALAAFQQKAGGNSQGTLVFVHADSKYYMTEQQTNTKLKNAAQEKDIVYIDQARLSGYHAEMRFVAYAEKEDISLKNATIWVSKPICKDCEDVLKLKGVTIQTSTSEEQYRNWISPDVGYIRVKSTGVFRGRRTEVDRLKDSFIK